MKRLRNTLLCILVLVFLLLACEKTPDKKYSESSSNVISDVSVSPQKNDSSVKTQNDSSLVELVPLEEARKEAMEIAGQTIEGFLMPDVIAVTDSNNISLYKSEIHYEEDYKTTESCLRKLWSGYDNFVESGAEATYYKYDEKAPDRTTGVTYCLASESGGMEVFTVADNGFLYNSGTVSCLGEPEKRYDIEWGDSYSEDEGFELADGFVTIKNAVETAEKLINDNFGILYAGVTDFKVQHIYVFKDESTGKYIYKMIVGCVFDGTSLDTARRYYNSRSGNVSGHMYTFKGKTNVFVMSKSDGFDSVSTCEHSMDFNKTETIDRVISPVNALKIVKKKLALGGIDQFEQAGLIYFFKERDLDYGEEPTQEEIESMSIIRPYWVFTNRKKSGFNNTEGNYDAHENSVFVDAITGEVFFCNASTVAPY